MHCQPAMSLTCCMSCLPNNFLVAQPVRIREQWSNIVSVSRQDASCMLTIANPRYIDCARGRLDTLHVRRRCSAADMQFVTNLTMLGCCSCFSRQRSSRSLTAAAGHAGPSPKRLHGNHCHSSSVQRFEGKTKFTCV